MRTIWTLLVMAALTGGAFAQDRDAPADSERGELLQKKLEEAATTRARVDAPPIGLAPAQAERPRIDWAAVRSLVEETRQRDLRSATIATRVERVRGLRAIAPQQFELLSAAEVARTELPVLAPARPEIVASLQVIGQANAYTAIAELSDGAALRISGAAKRVVLPDARVARVRAAALQRKERVLPTFEAPFVISRSDSSTDLSLPLFGAGYVLSIVCDDPDNDPRCAADDYIIDLASDLAVLNIEQGGE